MNANLLTVAIVNYNNRKELEKCLRSIQDTKGALKLEIYVYDNNSTDGSVPR
jgi:GT2 family glycosyltransferase